MLTELNEIQASGLRELVAIADESGLENFRVAYLGKKGRLTALAAAMKSVPPDQRAAVGAKLNEARSALGNGIDEKLAGLQAAKDAEAVKGIDLTLPGRPARSGALHPLTRLRDRAVQALRRMGFSLADGPEIETEWHCFDALNTPADHPARNEKDTFYLPDGRLLRTHTSTVQIRTMETAGALPVRIIAPGAAYRRDEIDATHLSVFNQLEGLYVDRDVSVADLKGTLEFFFQEIFGAATQVRFRPHYFPFTEPSYEIDIKLEAKGQEAKWIEIAGCGMVDPAVFESVSQARGDQLFDPSAVTGFAFGLGLDRLAMILHGITDIRHLIENDVRFLEQF
ncbi:MAG TPA: phenylalanine--tRNA ligase subunit alpha [Verrucomicrobiaceae bacterium]|jgi:phenylalanyl-tRNA synthetase alpha chain